MPTQPGLTGRRRYRVLKRLFRDPVLVLQIETKGFVPEYNGGGAVDGEITTWWRDAPPELLPTEDTQK